MREDLKDKLADLVKRASDLQLGMYKECKILTEAQTEKYKNNIVSFKDNYQSWYSESLEVVRQILPNRLDDFSSFYKSKEKRKEADYETYTVHDYLMGLTSTLGIQTVAEPKAAIPKFQQQLLILKSAYELFDSKLIDIHQILQADLFDSEVEAARHLCRNGFVRAAGAMVGVVLESHLQQICADHDIKITKKNPGINDLAQLLKDAETINTPEWRRIQHLSDLRNLCDHKKDKDPTVEQINDLIDGVAKVIKTVF